MNEKPAFLADAMLGSIAKKLRIFGFDTLYVPHIHDDEVLKIASAQDRIILTCDRELFKRAIKMEAKGVLLEGLDEYDDLVHLLSKNSISSVGFDTENTRCSACNALLEDNTPEQVREYVPAAVIQRHNKFFKCIGCYKIYWEGSHLERIQAFARRLNRGLKSHQNLL